MYVYIYILHIFLPHHLPAGPVLLGEPCSELPCDPQTRSRHTNSSREEFHLSTNQHKTHKLKSRKRSDLTLLPFHVTVFRPSQPRIKRIRKIISLLSTSDRDAPRSRHCSPRSDRSARPHRCSASWREKERHRCSGLVAYYVWKGPKLLE